MAALVGYARVSRKDQSLQAQVSALEAAGCTRIFAEKVSSVAVREQWADLLNYVRPGDTVCVVRLDRIGRRLVEIVREIAFLECEGVSVRALAQGIDTAGPGGRLLVSIFAALAETEREILRERTREGLNAARAKGKKCGRPLKLTPAVHAQIAHLRAQGFSVREVATAVHLSTKSVMRALDQAASKEDAKQLRLEP